MVWYRRNGTGGWCQLSYQRACVECLSWPAPHSAYRPLQPKSFGAAHLAAVYVLTYLGAFCAALLAASYASQNVQQWQVRLTGGDGCVPLTSCSLHARAYFNAGKGCKKGSSLWPAGHLLYTTQPPLYHCRHPSLQAGMLYCGLLTAMALGLPFGLAVFPVHAARYMRAAAAARRGGPEAQPELVAPFQDEVDEPLLLVRSAPKLCACLHGLPVLWAGWWGLLVCIGMTAVQHQRAVQVRVLPSTAHSPGMIAARSALRLLSLLSRFHCTLRAGSGHAAPARLRRGAAGAGRAPRL